MSESAISFDREDRRRSPPPPGGCGATVDWDGNWTHMARATRLNGPRRKQDGRGLETPLRRTMRIEVTTDIVDRPIVTMTNTPVQARQSLQVLHVVTMSFKIRELTKNVCQRSWQLLPRDASQSAAMQRHVVCPYLCPSVTLRYGDHIGWNTWEKFTAD